MSAMRFGGVSHARARGRTKKYMGHGTGMKRQDGGSMRERMPGVAAFVDALRDAFGREHIDECIRRGMREGEGPDWYFSAWENGHTIGRQKT